MPCYSNCQTTHESCRQVQLDAKHPDFFLTLKNLCFPCVRQFGLTTCILIDLHVQYANDLPYVMCNVLIELNRKQCNMLHPLLFIDHATHLHFPVVLY